MRRVAPSLLLVVSACAAQGAPISASTPLEDGTKSIVALQAAEDDILGELAALDRRIATRSGIEPSDGDLRSVAMGSVLAEDPTLAVIDGAIDSFSFEARARGLATVRAKLEAAPRSLPARAAGSITAPALERELLERLVDAERVRIDEERALPRLASAHVRGIVETWKSPQSPQQAAERDRWLARRIDDILATVSATTRAPKAASVPLDVVRARELDDTLDALEHAIDAAGLVHATGELVMLREALEAQGSKAAAAATSEWPTVERSIRAHLGLSLAADAIDARLMAIEADLASAAATAIAKAHVSADVVQTQAAKLVFARTPCRVAVPGSRIRSMAPPPERAAVCLLARMVASATDETSRAVALVVLHDHATMARWALDVARGTATVAQTTAKHRPLSSPGPEVTAKWERMALAQPTAVIGAGIAAGLLYGTGDIDARARAYSELGDVPIDIAERELRRTAP